MFGDLLPVWLRVLQPLEILSIQLCEPDAVSGGDDVLEAGPAEAEAAGLPSGQNSFWAPGVSQTPRVVDNRDRRSPPELFRAVAQESVRVPGEADHSTR